MCASLCAFQEMLLMMMIMHAAYRRSCNTFASRCYNSMQAAAQIPTYLANDDKAEA
jgi:hypothetical protein